MNPLSNTSIDILSIMALCFIIGLSLRNVIINKRQNTLYILAVVATIINLVLELSWHTFLLPSNSNLIIWNYLLNIIGFILTPLVPYFILLMRLEPQKIRGKVLLIPLFIFAFLCIASYKTGWIFTVDAQNVYSRGKLFPLAMLISMFYFILLGLDFFKKSKQYIIGDRIFIACIFCFITICSFMQIFFSEMLLIWGSVSFSLILYYIFLRELNFQYDPITHIRNRAAFEKDLPRYNKKKMFSVVVFDLNDLKDINDQYGHPVGDQSICCAANTIQESFNDIGTAYRIGGDEFCVLCHTNSKDLIELSLSFLDATLMHINQTQTIQILLAHGYATANGGEDIDTVLIRADEAMYVHKAELKKTAW